MKKQLWTLCSIILLTALAVVGCRTVNTLDTTSMEDEGQVVFTRAGEYTMLFGSRSPWDYFEVVAKRFSRNEAGFPVVEVDLRYRGGVSWTDWFNKVPQSCSISAVCNFYLTTGSTIAYATPREPLLFRLGRVTTYRAVCPVKEVMDFQLVLGE